MRTNTLTAINVLMLPSHMRKARIAREITVATNACPTERSRLEPSCEKMRNDPPIIPPIFNIPISLTSGRDKKPRTLAMSWKNIRAHIPPSDKRKINAIRLKIVIRKDLIHPRALQSAMKKKKDTMSPIICDENVLVKNDATQKPTTPITRLMITFKSVFQNGTISSFLSAKNTKRKLKNIIRARALRDQKGILAPVKY